MGGDADAETAYPDGYSAENQAAARHLTRRTDAWWDERLQQQEEKQLQQRLVAGIWAEGEGEGEGE